MRFDVLLKKYFFVVILAALSVVTYFQAAGVSAFVGARLTATPEGGAPAVLPPFPGSKRSASAVHHETSGAAILARNPFDSVTGPLDGVASEETPDNDGQVAVSEDALKNPYAAPDCTQARVLAITASEDPAWSIAAISVVGEKDGAKLMRVGDSVGEKRLWHITWDRVWLLGDGSVCQAKMFGDKKKVAKAKHKWKPKPSKRHRRGAVPDSIRKKIHKVSDTEFNVDRAVVDEILSNQAQLMRSARIIPEKQNGKVVGIRLLRVRPDSLLGVLGLKNGDRLEKINGFDMTSPEKALEAYARLRTAGHLNVAITRHGKPTTIDFNIR